MSGSRTQDTRLERLQRRWGRSLGAQIGRRWATGGTALLALLGGIFLGQNLSSILLLKLTGGRPMVVLAIVITHELLVRIRTRAVSDLPNLGWVVADNVRVGVVFALVLEAFKLGS
ncbi:MAG: DUF565 domain-containing protein [bacterium]|jgi:hypothetical protein